MREEVLWTNLTLTEIAEHLKGKGTPVSVTVVRQLLKRHNYVKRQAQKRRSLGRNQNADEQFLNIKRLRAEYQTSANPIVSMDTKKKELLGNFYRDGKLGCVHRFGHPLIGILAQNRPKYRQGNSLRRQIANLARRKWPS